MWRGLCSCESYAGLHITQVAQDRERFDYWVSDGRRHYGLEVSGTTLKDFERRHRQKVKQLRENPYRTDGYVVVVGFASKSVILSLIRFEEHAER